MRLCSALHGKLARHPLFVDYLCHKLLKLIDIWVIMGKKPEIDIIEKMSGKKEII